jgi:hypothetical protein
MNRVMELATNDRINCRIDNIVLAGSASRSIIVCTPQFSVATG